jgi:hypothetical protein
MKANAETAGPQTAFSLVQLHLPPEQRLHSILIKHEVTIRVMSLFSLIRFKPLNHYIQITLNRGGEKPENTSAHKRCEYTVQGLCNLQPPFQNLFRKLEQLQRAYITHYYTLQCPDITRTLIQAVHENEQYY